MHVDVGAELRKAREQRGISIEEVARRTKIGVSTLRALERNQIDRLPGGIFVRGFLRAYAREVALDPEDIVRRYLATFEPALDPVPATETPWPRSGSMWPPGLLDTVGLEPRAVVMTMLAVGVVIAIGAAGYVTVRGSRTPQSLDQAEPLQSTVPPRPPSVVSPAAEVGTSGRQEVVRLEIQTSGPCWVAATADGQTVIYRLLLAGERHVIEARDQIVLRVGDPAAFMYRINDMPGRLLGRPGQPVTIHIRPQTYREFISP